MSKNGKIKATKLCIGKECDIDLKTCPEKSKTVGSFHTHPTRSKTNFLSGEDIYTWTTDKKTNKMDMTLLGREGAEAFSILSPINERLVAKYKGTKEFKEKRKLREKQFIPTRKWVKPLFDREIININGEYFYKLINKFTRRK